MLTEGRKDDKELIKEEAEYKKEANGIAAVIKKLNEDEIRTVLAKGEITKDKINITSEQVLIEKKFLPQYEKDKVNVCLANAECGIRINTETNDEIMNSYFCREIVNKIQKLRKESGIRIQDDIAIVYSFGEKCDRLKKVSETMKETIEKSIKTKYQENENGLEGYSEHKTAEYEIGEEKEVLKLKIMKKN
ncbi:MAG: DUF5915 domain-containing protein [archaeon]|nr:DUF5915 domain-containing protein [archaeon]